MGVSAGLLRRSGVWGRAGLREFGGRWGAGVSGRAGLLAPTVARRRSGSCRAGARDAGREGDHHKRGDERSLKQLRSEARTCPALGTPMGWAGTNHLAPPTS
jgi:hypothetical protein